MTSVARRRATTTPAVALAAVALAAASLTACSSNGPTPANTSTVSNRVGYSSNSTNTGSTTGGTLTNPPAGKPSITLTPTSVSTPANPAPASSTGRRPQTATPTRFVPVKKVTTGPTSAASVTARRTIPATPATAKPAPKKSAKPAPKPKPKPAPKKTTFSALSGDGGVLAAINSYRKSRGLKAVTGGYDSTLSKCITANVNGPCGQNGAWEQSKSFSGSGGLNVLIDDNPKALNDKNFYRVKIGWTKVNESNGGTLYVVAISTYDNDGSWG